MYSWSRKKQWEFFFFSKPYRGQKNVKPSVYLVHGLADAEKQKPPANDPCFAPPCRGVVGILCIFGEQKDSGCKDKIPVGDCLNVCEW